MSIDEDDGEEPLIVHTSKPSGQRNLNDHIRVTERVCSGSRTVEAVQQSSTPRLLTFDSDSEDSATKDDVEMGTEEMNEFIAQRKTTSDPESDHDSNKSEGKVLN